jgi:hypothetical protein
MATFEDSTTLVSDFVSGRFAADKGTCSEIDIALQLCCRQVKLQYVSTRSFGNRTLLYYTRTLLYYFYSEMAINKLDWITGYLAREVWQYYGRAHPTDGRLKVNSILTGTAR